MLISPGDWSRRTGFDILHSEKVWFPIHETGVITVLNEAKIRCFLCLSETLSFTQTAKILFTSQQAVSKHILQMEEEFGFPLFLRSTRSVVLTPEGERLYGVFSAFIGDYDAVMAQCRAGARAAERVLHIGYQNWLEFGGAPARALASLRRKEPGLQLVGERYSPGRLVQLLRESRLDLILLHERFLPDCKGLDCLPLLRSPMMLIISANYPAVKGKPLSLGLFQDIPVLMDAFEGERPNETVARTYREFGQLGLEPGQIIIAPNRDSVYEGVSLGRGYAAANTLSQFKGEDILFYPLDAEEQLLCVWRKQRAAPLIQQYAAELAREFQRNPVKARENAVDEGAQALI